MKKIALATVIISIGMSLVGCNKAATPNSENEINSKITMEQAKEIALNHADLTGDEVSFIKSETDIDNGVEKYDIEFYHENKEYDYEINASDGKIIKYDYDVENYNISEKQVANGESIEITVEQAKEIALNHANLTSDQVTFVKNELDLDNAIKKYDIEFYYENKEYDYEINASDGQIIEYDYDAENYNKQQGNNTTKISVDQAKEIALKHMNVTSNEVTFKRVELDFDDGIQKYEVEFYNNNKEYSYEIDANTGDILSYEQD